MAQEAVRGCGYRVVGGLYLCGEYIPVPCDRLPYRLDTCPACGGGIKVSRAFTRIIPLQLFGYHQPCEDSIRPCMMCDPTEDPAFIMKVGERHYPQPADFVQEGLDLGVSKRIPFIPKELEIGKTVIYLAHPKACVVRESVALQQAMALVGGGDGESREQLLDAEKVERKMGIFGAFRPQRIEKLIWQKDATPEEMESLRKRGITPVIIKDGDPDHKGVN